MLRLYYNSYSSPHLALWFLYNKHLVINIPLNSLCESLYNISISEIHHHIYCICKECQRIMQIQSLGCKFNISKKGKIQKNNTAGRVPNLNVFRISNLYVSLLVTNIKWNKSLSFLYTRLFQLIIFIYRKSLHFLFHYLLIDFFLYLIFIVGLSLGVSIHLLPKKYFRVKYFTIRSLVFCNLI